MTTSRRTITDEGVAMLDLHDGRVDLLEEIMTLAPEHVAPPLAARRRTPLMMVGAAAAVVLIVGGLALLPFLLRGGGGGTATEPGLAGAPGDAVCWNGSTAATCPKPEGVAALTWVFPRLAGRLDDCEPALGAAADDPPMPYGTPGPGAASDRTGLQSGAFRCALDKLGADADPAAPKLWIYALGKASPWKDLAVNDLGAVVDHDPSPATFSIGGERAGPVISGSVGLVHPNHFFIAKYADYPFAVMGYADDPQQFELVLAALGARKPSEMQQPGLPHPAMPGFPTSAISSPQPTP